MACTVSHLVVVLSATVACLLSGAAAADVRRNDTHNAAGVCQGALPQFAGTLRARPTAIANEGDAVAFVSCSPLGGAAVGNAPRVRYLNLFVRNGDTVAVTVNCTLVNVTGLDPSARQYVSRILPLSPGTNGAFRFFATELPGAPAVILQGNASCQLPPGAEITTVQVGYDEAV